jgi:hypothetical protein
MAAHYPAAAAEKQSPCLPFGRRHRRMGSSVQEISSATLAEMDSGDLTREQLDTLKEQLDRSFAYLRVLQSRMEKQGFPYCDELWQRVEKATDAVHELGIRAVLVASHSGQNRLPPSQSWPAAPLRRQCRCLR